jgi:threonine dehydratase
MLRSIRAGRRVALERVGSFADGVAVRMVGETTFALCRDYLDDCITVSVDEICAAIKDVFDDTRAILEPAGALAVAGLTRLARWRGVPAGNAIAIASGANVDFDRLGSIAERSAQCGVGQPVTRRSQSAG